MSEERDLQEKKQAEDDILNAIDVAKYFSTLVDREVGDTITPHKLHKLMYLAQGIHLALYDKPLFKEEIKEWEVLGPIVPEIYHEFEAYHFVPIPLPSKMDFDIYTQQQKNLIFKVYSFYGEHSAVYLRNLIRQHSIMGKVTTIITKAIIQKFFKLDCLILNKLKDHIVSITQEDIAQIEKAEDEWLMNYDCGVPAEDITEYLLTVKKKKGMIKKIKL